MNETYDLIINSVREVADGFYRVNDMYHVPPCAGNRDYQAVQAWIAAGNKPIPFVEVPTPPEAEPLLTATMLAKLIEEAQGLPKQSKDRLLVALKNKGGIA